MVIPNCPGPAPFPGPDFLRAVATYLDRRRTVGTELHVVGPKYTRVSVHARLHVLFPDDTSGAAARARDALARFFNPLLGGPDNVGWPVGRPVYRAEVMALLAGLSGVAHVDRLGIFGPGDREPRCENLGVCADGLVESGDHAIEVVSLSSSRSISR